MLVALTSRRSVVRGVAGFTILQMLTAVTMLGILSAAAIPGYQIYIERARQARAIAQIAEIEIAISEFAMATNTGQLPADLAAIGLAGARDPWGESIAYVNLLLGGAPRVDQNGVAVNVDYDLYSAGPDGVTALSLTAPESEDDIVRASDGGFVGAVSNYVRLN